MGTSSQRQIALLTDYDLTSAYNRAYQTLYTNIRLSWNSEQIKQYAIQFTTPTASHRQAIVATNVAIAAAQYGTPVVLIDADLNTPSIQQHFALGEQIGFTDLLGQETLTQQLIATCLHKASIPDLYLLCAGQKTLSHTQESNRLFTTQLSAILLSIRQFLAATESRPAIIIFHGPPILTDNTNAIQISSIVNQTFLTIVSGHTTRTQATHALEHLQQANVPVAGTIMLDV